MSATTTYRVRVETADGERYLWDEHVYPTIAEARDAWTLDDIKRRSPEASKIIIVEVSERDLEYIQPVSYQRVIDALNSKRKSK